ncbi:hypothetical protein [Spirosoma sordidisoli]|uniref:DUF1080 domain-containing protein n=1 Tax=Spirosoma sordidisoli TaxID=2502893 RepID=A0A4Q2UHV7_9BACT|nr:hypothetical protein [Spirosoma sordidisoli]RYC68112.1 hypothetical protein EQG79_21910 [Spirosoma sordidisoli]
MRLFFSLVFTALLLTDGLAQTRRAKDVVYSASSDWQKVTLRPAAARRPATPTASASVPTPASAATPDGPATAAAPPSSPPTRRPAPAADPGYRPAFTGDFATNRNGWKAGVKGDYQYQIGLGKYNILKRRATQQAAFSFVPLPTAINLNIAEEYTIKVDIVADSGRIPTGGVVFGVRDSTTYSAFLLNGNGDIAIVRMADGQTFSDYMPGDYFKPGVALDKNRNRLIIRRKGDLLHFYINEQEVRSSPYPFKMLSGNGIGVTTTGYWTSFQKLTVTLGP